MRIRQRDVNIATQIIQKYNRIFQNHLTVTQT